ncbi:hatching enzyme 1.2 [Centroberyx affinis]|uniref:hatching enzyme 1.2 n=1 Tax=Centroberyx affinis TaxID=166261 RepID=UPI003A5C6430
MGGNSTFTLQWPPISLSALTCRNKGARRTQLTAVPYGELMQSDRNAVNRKWPEEKVPYAISPELVSRTNDILAAMTMVSEHTCITFHSRTTEANYLFFKTSQGCASYVGFMGGEQPVFVGSVCIAGNICHEILHALGFHHEHTRTDREKYITILPHNIMEGMERNFNEQNGKTFSLPYDITSIMHYGSGFFSANGLPTIISKKEEKNMGQRTHMTEVDMQRVRQLYNCDAKENQTAADWRQPGKNRHASLWRQEDPTSSQSLFSDLSATKTTDGFNQSSASPQLEDVIPASASPSPMMQQSNITTRGHNDTSSAVNATAGS